MANTLTYTDLWTTALDQQAQQLATSGWMEANASQVQYEGGKTVKVPTMETTGLGDYTRGTGSANRGKYSSGNVTLTYTDYKMEMDRSAEFAFDRHDVDETGFVVQAPTVMAEFQRANVVPELDAYRYSKIATLATTAGSGATTEAVAITAANVYSKLMSNIRTMQNITGIDTANLVITMPYTIYALLESSSEVTRMINVGDFSQGGVSFEVRTLNGIPIIPVVESRMKTKYTFNSGATTSGFTPASDAKTINWIVTPRNIPLAISKTDNVKTFSPDTNQNGDDWLVQYRKYHDLWIMKNQMSQVVVSTTA